MPDDFDSSEFADSIFHMYNSECKTVQLICANETMEAILDKFGMDVAAYAYDMKNYLRLKSMQQLAMCFTAGCLDLLAESKLLIQMMLNRNIKT